MAQVVSTWGTRIRGSLHHSIGKASRGFFERSAPNLATECDEQIRVPHVLKNMAHPAFPNQVDQLVGRSSLIQTKPG